MKKTISVIFTNFLMIFFCCRFYVCANFKIEGLLVHMMIYMSILTLLLITTKKVKFSYIFLNSLEFILGVISYCKMELRVQELQLWDLFFISDVSELLDFGGISLNMIRRMLLEFITVASVTYLQIDNFKKNCEIPGKTGKRFLIILCTISLIFFSFFYKEMRLKYIYPERIGFETYYACDGMIRYGVLGSLITDISLIDSLAYEVEEYSKDKIEEIYSEYVSYKIDGEQLEYDNVIVVLLESFVDIEKLINREIESDIIDNYHKITETNVNGNLHVSVLGGGTANVEYETLTMYDVNQYYNGVYPYLYHIKDEISAFPHLFKENGYTTTAIHPYMEAFYNRNKVYPLMGFDRFLSEDDFENQKRYGQYISDMEIYNKVVETIESEEKSFIKVVTMGTHPAYGKVILPEYDEYVEYENVKATQKINDYMQRLRKTDEMVGKLVEYINSSDEKTLLILYGDHFPMLSYYLDNLDIVEKGTYNISPSVHPELYETPYAIISNIPENKIKPQGDIVPEKLGIYILENVKLEKMPWIYNVVYDSLKNGKNKDFYKLIQYDDVHGEQYWKGF